MLYEITTIFLVYERKYSKLSKDQISTFRICCAKTSLQHTTENRLCDLARVKKYSANTDVYSYVPRTRV